MAAAATSAAATAATSRAAPSADSYIGSLISLTSKSEIRYEGVLYNINTEESSIGLRNVRSFGTEGRKKDGQQIPPSDRVYEYILFRGSDIKDLQVKSSPPVQTAPPIHSDPAIIQSHYSRPAAPVSTSASLPSVGSGTIADLDSHTTQMMAARPTFQSGLPLYQPGGNLGAWGPPPPPAANGSGLLPMYWQGYYTPPGGMPHLQPPPLLRPAGPPPGMPIPQAMQQPLQYSSVNPSIQPGSQGLPGGANVLLPSGLPNFAGTNASSQSAPTNLPVSTTLSGFSIAPGLSTSLPSTSSNLSGISTSLSSGSSNVTGSNVLPSSSLNSPEYPPPLLPPVSGNLISTMMPSSIQSTNLSLDAPLIPLPNKPPVSSLPSAIASEKLPFESSVSPNLDPTVTPATSKLKSALGTESISQPTTLSVPSVTASSSSVLEASGPSSSTRDQLQSGSSADSSSQSLEKSHKTTAPEDHKLSTIESKDAILPLPKPSDHKILDAPFSTHHGNRGRGRGRGTAFSSNVTKFTEDFDFTAMNEKFNKDEVWGHLGKSSGHVRGKEGILDENSYDDDEDIPEDYSEDHSNIEVKPVYVKDDFFDSLSSNSLNAGARNGRARFSEQRKIDTETFGDFPRHRPGRGGGRGFRGGGRARGSFYGRGYGHSGRGRGYSY